MSKESQNVCPICGQPTRTYYGHPAKDGLCRYHANMLKEGTTGLKGDTYYFIKANKPVNDDQTEEREQDKKSNADSNRQDENDDNSKCILCGNPSNGKPLCYNDYEQADDMSIDLIRSNNNSDDLITYYKRLKNNLYKMYGDQMIKDNCIKLVAISIALRRGFDYHYYDDVVFEDIKKIQDCHNKKTVNVTEVSKKMDEAGSRVFPSEDHHELDSQSEADIDDILFQLQKNPTLLNKKMAPYHIPHVDVLEIHERGVNADWYVGFPYYRAAFFYIEYWGVKNNAAYEKNKEEKEALYEKYNIPILGIEAEEIKSKNTLTNKIKAYLIQRVNEQK